MSGADPHRKAGARDPLLRDGWAYVEKWNMADFRADDWRQMNRQRAEYMKDEQARQMLELFAASKSAPTFGYAINNFEHGLQTATFLQRDGHDEETVVCGLLHDIGFIVCPENHGLFAAALLGPYVSARNAWMIERHQIFQRIHLHEYDGLDDPDIVNERERWRGHPHFGWTAEFVEKYDIVTIDPTIESMPLSTFEPMVRRVFARPPAIVPVE